MPGRWGYFVDKEPYDKICLPHHLLGSPKHLREAIRHEFMHDITLNLCSGHDPRWFAEAMATLVEGRVNRASWAYFQSVPRDWHGPTELVSAHASDHREAGSADAVTLAYDQSSFLALYLFQNGGVDKLKALLHAIGDESLFHNLERIALGRTRADVALRHIYGWSEDELFHRTLRWIQSSDRIPEPAF